MSARALGSIATWAVVAAVAYVSYAHPQFAVQALCGLGAIAGAGIIVSALREHCHFRSPWGPR